MLVCASARRCTYSLQISRNDGRMKPQQKPVPHEEHTKKGIFCISGSQEAMQPEEGAAIFFCWNENFLFLWALQECQLSICDMKEFFGTNEH